MSPVETLQEPVAKRVRHTLPTWLGPWGLALFFGLWGLRGVTTSDIVYADAARHAMNGVFVRDMLANGQWMDPLSYGKFYYAHLPALSIPFHPPLFPVVESLFFMVFGVNLLAARLAIAVATVAAFLLLIRFLVATGLPRSAALAAVAAFGSLGLTQDVAGDVMLEFPSLVLAAAALYCLRDIGDGLGMQRGILFALFAAAAVWTKQHTVFLGLMPFVYAIAARRWRIILSPALWVSSGILAAGIFAFFALSQQVRGTGFDQVATRGDWILWSVTNNLRFYSEALVRILGLVPALALAAAFAWALFPVRGARNTGIDLSLAWIVSYALLLLWLGPFDERYLFYLFPPMFAVGFAAAWRLSAKLVPDSYVWTVPTTLGALCFGLGLTLPPQYLRGPMQAARVLVSGAPERILYCGTTVNGPFIFAVRTLDPQLRTIVLNADKFDEQYFEPAALEKIAQRYGITHVVVEYSERDPHWEALRARPPASMILEREIPVASSHRTWNGSLRIFRLANTATHPEQDVTLDIPKIGGGIDLSLKR